jgi:putative transposase
MDGKGRAIDNIFIERLWRTVKYENVYLQAYTDGISLYRGLKDYFEFYNTRRLHQSLDYGTPYNNYYKRSGIKSRITFLAFKIAKSYLRF